jgi:acetolactate synthase-1/3 small subunit
MDPAVSLITLIVSGSSKIVTQIVKQLRKLINVIKVVDLSDVDYVERQLVIVRVKAQAGNRDEIMRLCDIFRGRIIDVSSKTYTMEITGGQAKIKAALGLLSEFGIEDQVSTGLTAIARSSAVKGK